MSLFNNYQKPGRGISPEEAAKRNYFKILGRKITILIKVNLLFFAVNIILFAAILFLIIPLFIKTGNASNELYIKRLSDIVAGKKIMSPFPFIILALFAPTVSGLTYICRNCARQQHVFLVSDFFEHTKKNFKQSIIAGFIMSAVLYFYITAVFYYLHSGMTVFAAILFIVGIILAMSSFYVFPQIVTFEMSLLSIFKNSFLYSIINLPQNALVLIVLSVLHIMLLLRFTILWLLLMVFFLIAFSSYTINYIVWNAISKYIEE